MYSNWIKSSLWQFFYKNCILKVVNYNISQSFFVEKLFQWYFLEPIYEKITVFWN